VRSFPAVELAWPAADDDRLDQYVAIVDEDGPAAVEPTATGGRIFFQSSEARARALTRLRAFDASLQCRAVDVPDDAWAERSQAALTSIRVGRIVVTPPWLVPATHQTAADDDVVVAIRPSMGFGTAHHASTRLCLRLLLTRPVADVRALDVGTGSGVLAIAAAKLGASGVVALDHDPDALTSARENIKDNGVGAIVDARLGDLVAAPLAELPPAAGLVLANLTGALVIRAAARLRALVAPGGSLIVSGVLGEEAAAVSRALEEAGVTAVQRLEEEGWVGLAFRVPAGS
jgi:ribosomal protein L11 methyltransferase